MPPSTEWTCDRIILSRDARDFPPPASSSPRTRPCQRKTRPQMKRSLNPFGWRVFCLPLLLAGSGAEAARQGSLGAVSAGSMSISISVAPRTSIGGASDVRFSRLSNESGTPMGFCLSSTSPDRSYMVAALGSGEDGAFELSNGSDSIGYAVKWSSREEYLPTLRALSEARRDELGSAVTQLDCAASSGPNLMIMLEPARAQAVRSGTPYTGTLTVLVSPN